MRKLFLTVLFFVFAGSAFSLASIPDELFVKEKWLSLTKTYTIETATNQLGSITKRFTAFLLTYDFYDERHVLTLTAKAKFFKWGTTLDIYKPDGKTIGRVEEHIFSFFPTFTIYAGDLSTPLATAEMNFWGTVFHVYDPRTHVEMVTMSRSFLRLKNDWVIQVVNRPLLEQKNIHPQLLMTVLAVQAEIESWKKSSSYSSTLSLNESLKQLQNSPSSRGHHLSEAEQAFLFETLDRDFHASDYLTPAEKLQAFTDFINQRLSQPDMTAEKKNAVLNLLKSRLSDF